MLQIPETLVRMIKDAMRSGFTGCIELHWFQGKPVKAKRIEETKLT